MKATKGCDIIPLQGAHNRLQNANLPTDFPSLCIETHANDSLLVCIEQNVALIAAPLNCTHEPGVQFELPPGAKTIS